MSRCTESNRQTAEAMAGPSSRVDLRAVLPVAALGVVVLVIIFVELCGREDVAPLDGSTAVVQQETATPGPTFTPGPSPTTGPSPTGAPVEVVTGGEDRDTARVQDLTALQEALEQYREENGAYPDTDGNVQTLCVFFDADAGCDLEEVLGPVPQDPLGEPVSNGYWYVSTGRLYVVFAQRESELFPACDEHPEHLRDFDSVLCARGP